MIYCNLKGGLANMLFQIAATKSIGLDKGVDVSFPNLDHQLNYLNSDSVYNPNIQHAFEYNLIFDKLNTTKPNYPIGVINFPFEYKKIEVPDLDYLVDGFFQSEKYFKKHRKEILELFKIPEIIKQKIQNKYSDLFVKRTTSIHVRRGDYIKHPNHHPTQTLEYYLESANYLKDKTDLFIIFSDDIAWCIENIKLENIIYIENERDYVELYLMSLCDNNIISNSSFSWWGAWLNINENKIVIGPKKWFGPAITHSTVDILPETWLQK